MIDILKANKQAWDNEVDKGRDSCIPVSVDKIAKARKGDILLTVTQTRIVPKDWLGDVRGKKILALAGGGGQQGPLLAAAGADVTVVDISSKQLDQDRKIMLSENLQMELVEGPMSDLSQFPANRFDMVIHPVSNCYTEDVNVVWKECFRVLKAGGSLISGFDNPVGQIMDWDLQEQGIFQLKYKLPYADTTQLEKEKLAELVAVFRLR